MHRVSTRALVSTLLVLTLLLSSFSVRSFANPLNGDINVQGTVLAAPPSQAAVITQPAESQQFISSPITVSGTCAGNTIIEIYKNNVFGGSGPCTSNTFSITVDLFIGNNTLIAKIKDSLGQYGPDSLPVDVVYVPVSPPSPVDPGAGGGSGGTVSLETQLLLLIDTDYRGSFPGDWLVIRPSIVGGVAPYAIKIDWGDGTEEIIARKSNGQFDVGHKYKDPGIKTIKIYASDETGQKAFIQTVAIINGSVFEDQDSDNSIITMSQNNWWWITIIATMLIIGILIGLLVGLRRYRKHLKDKHPESESN